MKNDDKDAIQLMEAYSKINEAVIHTPEEKDVIKRAIIHKFGPDFFTSEDNKWFLIGALGDDNKEITKISPEEYHRIKFKVQEGQFFAREVLGLRSASERKNTEHKKWEPAKTDPSYYAKREPRDTVEYLNSPRFDQMTSEESVKNNDASLLKLYEQILKK